MVTVGIGAGKAIGVIRRHRNAPDRGDLVYLDFDPQAGHEQSGRRPALVISPQLYNQATSLMLCCPITSRVKGYPFEVPVSGTGGVTGVILSDQLRSLDWVARHAEVVGQADEDVLDDVLAKISPLLR